jgi:transposase-like protein
MTLNLVPCNDEVRNPLADGAPSRFAGLVPHVSSRSDYGPWWRAIERGGIVRAEVVPDVKRSTLQSRVRETVQPGAAVYTDALSAYSGLDADYAHEVVDHAECYVNGQVHTNYMENFWALLKRGLHGTYISVEPFHLFRYLDERVFTFNMRELDDYGRFSTVLGAVTGRRLTYAQLTGR